ncbi:hypothetical protein AB5I41_17360 [Sphingomonas sp. MMS24-JH45]
MVLSRGVNATDERLFSRKVALLARLAFVVAVGLAVALGIAAGFVFPLLYGQRFAQSAQHPASVLLPGIVAFIVFRCSTSISPAAVVRGPRCSSRCRCCCSTSAWAMR